ncbi:hypothetical protein [Paenibacillus sp. PL2-23]|uniref:hypothetical protein n=1 Tax=Paenibacillus sp. PL2-23 TaxID=2100729 RepID=UPI0030F6BB16
MSRLSSSLAINEKSGKKVAKEIKKLMLEAYVFKANTRWNAVTLRDENAYPFAASELSRILGVPVLFVRASEDDGWAYSLYLDGHEVVKYLTNDGEIIDESDRTLQLERLKAYSEEAQMIDDALNMTDCTDPSEPFELFLNAFGLTLLAWITYADLTDMSEAEKTQYDIQFVGNKNTKSSDKAIVAQIIGKPLANAGFSITSGHYFTNDFAFLTERHGFHVGLLVDIDHDRIEASVRSVYQPQRVVYLKEGEHQILFYHDRETFIKQLEYIRNAFLSAGIDYIESEQYEEFTREPIYAELDSTLAKDGFSRTSSDFSLKGGCMSYLNKEKRLQIIFKHNDFSIGLGCFIKDGELEENILSLNGIYNWGFSFPNRQAYEDRLHEYVKLLRQSGYIS